MEDLPRLFSVHFRGRAALSDVAGSRLGLEITKRLVNAYRGTIIVRGSVEGPTTLAFNLPSA